MESLKMNKTLFWFLIFFLFATSLFANEAIVIVLNAPLLSEPKMESRVLQTVRKGQKIFIPREEVSEEAFPEYFTTYDRAGNLAYIPSQYVKPILKTTDEKRDPITLSSSDPTDYRLEEPIPSTYPFEDNHFVRTSISLLMANNLKSPYNYNSPFNDQDFGMEMGMRLTVTKKAQHDQYDRFYFGVIGFITSAKNKIQFKDGKNASESRDQVRAGPWVTFDAFKNEKYKLAMGTGFTFNYHRSLHVYQMQVQSEQRFFNGYSISPMGNLSFQINNIIPHTDLITGLDLNLYLPHTLTSNDKIVISDLWPEEKTISVGFKTQASAFIGFQVKY
jgi:hypothetical protein